MHKPRTDSLLSVSTTLTSVDGSYPLDSSKQATPCYNKAHYCLKLNIDWMNKHVAQPQDFHRPVKLCETEWGLGLVYQGYRKAVKHMT